MGWWRGSGAWKPRSRPFTSPDFHPFGDFLIFRDVADLGVGLAADVAGVGSQDGGGTLRGGDEIHEHFDGGGFTGTILPDQGVKSAFRHVEIDTVDGSNSAEVLGELLRMNRLVHEWLAAYFGVGDPFPFRGEARPLFADGILDVVELDAKTFGFDNKLLDLVLQEIRFLGFAGGGTLSDNRSRTGTDFKKAGVDKARDDLVRCVGIDFELTAEDADRRKIVAGTQPTGDDGFCCGVDNLLVKRRTGSEVDVERDHRCVL